MKYYLGGRENPESATDGGKDRMSRRNPDRGADQKHTVRASAANHMESSGSVSRSEGEQMNRTTRFHPAPKILLALSLLAVATVSARGDEKSAALYKSKCSVCHGAAGKGDSPAGKNMGVLSFSDPKVQAKSDAELREVIDKGKNKMPAYGKSLKPEDIQGLVAYIRSLK
jgi:cytochrome c6